MITPKFNPGDMVCHITDETCKGVVTGFMIRGYNHSFQVQWEVTKSEWHLDFELIKRSDEPKKIGFWSENGKP